MVEWYWSFGKQTNEAFTNQCWFDSYPRILRHLQLTSPSSPSFLQSNHM
jgi:hypothetical protein